MGSCSSSEVEEDKQKRNQVKRALGQWSAFHAVSEQPGSQEAKAQGL